MIAFDIDYRSVRSFCYAYLITGIIDDLSHCAE